MGERRADDDLFFLVGLEIKREISHGELRSLRKAALPILAAVGGMALPATIYLLLQGNGEGQRGWGIPMATDIAFAVGMLTLLGKRVPIGLKIFLLALAIADDIGAIVVIALFYSSNLSITALGLAALGVAFVYGMARLGIRSVAAYFLVGAAIWLAMFHSGIHPTIAGVALGLMTPSRAWIEGRSFIDFLLDAADRLDGDIERTQIHGHPRLAGDLALAARESVSPLERLETALHPWVAFVIECVAGRPNDELRRDRRGQKRDTNPAPPGTKHQDRAAQQPACAASDDQGKVSEEAGEVGKLEGERPAQQADHHGGERHETDEIAQCELAGSTYLIAGRRNQSSDGSGCHDERGYAQAFRDVERGKLDEPRP